MGGSYSQISIQQQHITSCSKIKKQLTDNKLIGLASYVQKISTSMDSLTVMFSGDTATTGASTKKEYSLKFQERDVNGFLCIHSTLRS